MGRSRQGDSRRVGRRFPFSLACVLALVAATASRETAAESILLNPPSGWNGIFLSGSINAGWRQSGGAAVVSVSTTSFLLAGPSNPPLTPGQILTGAPLNLTFLPNSGETKDKAQASLQYSVTVGAAGPGGSDKFNFAFSAETSAMDAKVDFGAGIGVANADAYAVVDFFIQSSAPIPASTLASIGLPAIPTLSAPAPSIETLVTTARIGPYGAWTTTIVMDPGYGGSVLPLVLGPSASDAFLYRMTYTILTPYGSDPSVSFAFEGTMARAEAVPEIGLSGAPLGVLLGALGLLEAGLRPRRGRAGADGPECSLTPGSRARPGHGRR
jgi:hypothetical protein